MKNILILFFLVSLVSCKGMQIRTVENKSFKEFSTKPWIEIKESLTVTPTNARVYIQNGIQIPPSKLNHYDINCEIEVRKVLEFPQTVNPGRFEITRVSTKDSMIVFLKSSNIQYAMGGGKVHEILNALGNSPYNLIKVLM